MGVEVGVALAAAQVIGSAIEGNAQEKALNAQAEADDANAIIAGRAASDAARRGDYAAVRHKLAAGQVAGEQTARLAASGLDTTSGTLADNIGQTHMSGDLDALMAQNDAASEAYGYSVQKANLHKTADLKRQAARQALPLSLLAGVTRGAAQFLPTVRQMGA